MATFQIFKLAIPSAKSFHGCLNKRRLTIAVAAKRLLEFLFLFPLILPMPFNHQPNLHFY